MQHDVLLLLLAGSGEKYIFIMANKYGDLYISGLQPVKCNRKRNRKQMGSVHADRDKNTSVAAGA